MRRKQGKLVTLEISILEAGLELRKRDIAEFHGFMIAKVMKEREGARLLTAYGTLYKALDRLEKGGLLASHWEDPLIAASENRPRRRFYKVTAAGAKALAKARTVPGISAMTLQPGKAQS